MPGFFIYRDMQNVRYDFSSVHIDVPSPLAEELMNWTLRNVKDGDLYIVPGDSSYGREDEMHVTVLYGLHSNQPDEVKKLVTGEPKIQVKLGEINIFPNPKFDVLIVEVESKELRDLNKKLEGNVEYTNKYDRYRPHITLAYIKKNRGWKHRGKRVWSGQQFETSKIVFSSKNGIKERISF